MFLGEAFRQFSQPGKVWGEGIIYGTFSKKYPHHKCNKTVSRIYRRIRQAENSNGCQSSSSTAGTYKKQRVRGQLSHLKSNRDTSVLHVI